MALIPDIKGKYDDLFVQFLNEPGVLENLKGIVLRVKCARTDSAVQNKFKKSEIHSKPETCSLFPPRSPRDPLNNVQGTRVGCGDKRRLSQDMHDALSKLKIKRNIQDLQEQNKLEVSELNNSKQCSDSQQSSFLKSPILDKKDFCKKSVNLSQGSPSSDISTNGDSELRFFSSTLVESIVIADDLNIEKLDESNGSSKNFVPSTSLQSDVSLKEENSEQTLHITSKPILPTGRKEDSKEKGSEDISHLPSEDNALETSATLGLSSDISQLSIHSNQKYEFSDIYDKNSCLQTEDLVSCQPIDQVPEPTSPACLQLSPSKSSCQLTVSMESPSSILAESLPKSIERVAASITSETSLNLMPSPPPVPLSSPPSESPQASVSPPPLPLSSPPQLTLSSPLILPLPSTSITAESTTVLLPTITSSKPENLSTLNTNSPVNTHELSVKYRESSRSCEKSFLSKRKSQKVPNVSPKTSKSTKSLGHSSEGLDSFYEPCVKYHISTSTTPASTSTSFASSLGSDTISSISGPSSEEPALSAWDDLKATVWNSSPSPPRHSTPNPLSQDYTIYDKFTEDQELHEPLNQSERSCRDKPAHIRTLAKLISRRSKQGRGTGTDKRKSRQVHVECNSECDHTASILQIPAFYLPLVPVAALSSSFVIQIQEFFNSIMGTLTIETAGPLCSLLEFPFYLRSVLFLAFNRPVTGEFTCTEFLTEYQRRAVYLQGVDKEEAVYNILTRFGQDKRVKAHQIDSIINDVILSDPSLEFFRQEDSAYQDKMVDCYRSTVLMSVLYAGDGWARRELSFKQLKQTNFINCLHKVYVYSDLSSVEVEHFSYDQFYVLYVKFLNLDSNQDYLIDKLEFAKSSSGMMTSLIINRIFEVNLATSPNGLMSFEDFVLYQKAVIDKSSSSSVHYWFRVLDLDCDGYLSENDLFTFFFDSMKLTMYMTVDVEIPDIKFNDILAQFIDSSYPQHHLEERCVAKATSTLQSKQMKTKSPGFSLSDIRKNENSIHLIDAFVNVLEFIVNDENTEVTRRMKNTPWINFIRESLLDLDMEEE